MKNKILLLLIALIFSCSNSTSLIEDKRNKQKQENEVFRKDSLEKVEYEAKNDSIRKEELKNSIAVLKCKTYSEEYSSSIDYNIAFQNKSKKSIKYITFTVDGYNAVNDIVESSRGEVTGPIKANEKSDSRWTGWYNSTVKTIKIREIQIEYIDGSRFGIVDKDEIEVVMKNK